jgi:hypothetical protein
MILINVNFIDIYEITMWLARLQLVQIRHTDGVTQLVGDGGRVEEDGELEAVGLRPHLGHLV